MNFKEYETDCVALYQEFCQTIRSILEKVIVANRLPRPQSIQCRAKDPKKLKARLEQLGALESNSIEDLRRDLAGVRIIFYTNTDVDRFVGSRLIFENFEVEEDGIKVHHPTEENDKSQYRGIHYTIRLKSDRAKLAEYAKYRALRCEVQVQTILHHAWSETSHDILYKTESRTGFGGRATETIQSRFNRIMTKYLIPAGYEFQRVQHDYERLQQGKELFDRDLLSRLADSSNNNDRHEIIVSLKRDVLPNYDDISAIYSDVLRAIVNAAKQSVNTPVVPIVTPFGEMRGKTATDIAMAAVELIDAFRYADITSSFNALRELSTTMDESIVRKKILDVVASLAKYDLDVWKNVGPSIQMTLLDTISALPSEARIVDQEIVLAVCGQVLSPEIEGAEWNVNSVTLRTGTVPAVPQIVQMRERVISILFELFRTASTDFEKRKVINVLRQANYLGRAEVSSDIVNMTLKDSITINKFLTEECSNISYELKESIEHDSWYEYRRARDISVSALRAECHTSALALMRSIEELRDKYNEDEIFVKFKVLVGFESVFPFQWAENKQRNADDFKARENYRTDEAIRYVESINSDNEGAWFTLIERVASVESNDMATFPPFTAFLTNLARSKPRTTARLLQRQSKRLFNFLPAILAGLYESDDRDTYHELVKRVLGEGDHLAPLARHLRFTREASTEFADRTLARAIDIQDDLAVAECLMMAIDTRPENPSEGYRFFRPAIEYLNAREVYWWILSPWIIRESSTLLASLTAQETRLFIPAIVHIPKIEYPVERILIQIAKHHPDIVWECFARRLEKKEAVGRDRYEPVPYQFHGLEEELSKNPKAAIEYGQQLYANDSKLFRYHGGRLLSIAFPKCPPSFANELSELVKRGSKDDVLFTLAVLENYEGEETTHDVLKEIVAQFSEDENVRTGAAISFENTGVVMGEFGFANAMREKLSIIRSWEDDARAEVRKFAESMIRHLQLRIANEMRRAEERKALRELEYEESDQSSKSTKS